MKLWKRWTLTALIVALLMALDTAITWHIASKDARRAGSAPAYVEAEADAMSRFKLEREQLRAREEAQLNDIIHSDSSDPQLSADAQRQLMDMLSMARTEQTLEGILQSRGFEDALVSLSADSANVLLRRAALTQRETAVILELVMRQTGLTGGNVKIIPVK